jgi:hypothetical protein
MRGAGARDLITLPRTLLMRQPTELPLRRVPRRLGLLFSAPTVLLLIAMVLGGGPAGWRRSFSRAGRRSC